MFYVMFFITFLCNVLDVVSSCNALPRPADSNDLVIVKLENKLEYRGHVYFEPVPPRLTLRILQFLKKSNPLYHDIAINLSIIPDCSTQHNKEKETFFSSVNILDYVTPDELIPIPLETALVMAVPYQFLLKRKEFPQKSKQC